MSDDSSRYNMPTHIEGIIDSVNHFYDAIGSDRRFNLENPNILSCIPVDLGEIITDEALLSEVRGTYANPIEIVKNDGSRFYIFMTGLSSDDYTVPNIQSDLNLMGRLGDHLNRKGIRPYLVEFFPGGLPKMGRIPKEDLTFTRGVAAKFKQTYIDNSTNPILLQALSTIMPTVKVIKISQMLEEIARLEQLNSSGGEA
jgi:hypothetical protein